MEAFMKCPSCQCDKSYVTTTRHKSMGEDAYIRRYRKCKNCGAIFPTFECYELVSMMDEIIIAQARVTVQQLGKILNVRG